MGSGTSAQEQGDVRELGGEGIRAVCVSMRQVRDLLGERPTPTAAVAAHETTCPQIDSHLSAGDGTVRQTHGTPIAAKTAMNRSAWPSDTNRRLASARRGRAPLPGARAGMMLHLSCAAGLSSSDEEAVMPEPMDRPAPAVKTNTPKSATRSRLSVVSLMLIGGSSSRFPRHPPSRMEPGTGRLRIPHMKSSPASRS